MEIRQARKSSVSIMPVFFCGGSGTKTQEGQRQEEEGPAQGQKTGHRRPEGEVEVYGWGVRKGEETQETHPQGGERREMQKSVHRMESDEERGRWAPSRFPRKTIEGRSQRLKQWEDMGPDMGPVGTVGEDEPQGPQERGDREIQTEREKKKEKRVISRPGCHP